MCWNQKVDDADSWLPYQQPVRRMSMSWSHTATPLSHPVFKNFSLKVFEQGEKTALRMGENNSKWSNWQRINLKNKQAAHAAQFQKNKRPNQKMGQRTKKTFLQRRHLEDPWECEKMLNVANYWRNVNQNYSEVSPHTGQTGHH